MRNVSREEFASKDIRIPRSRTIAHDRDIAESSLMHNRTAPSLLSPTSIRHSPSARIYQPNRKGRNMIEEGEYVETRALSPTSSRGGSMTMSSALKRQAAMQSMTVRLPKNPFIDDDYADMTGHQRSPAKMDMMRSTMKHSPMKNRSQSASGITTTEIDSPSRDVIDGRSSIRDSKNPRTRSATTTSQSPSMSSNHTSIAEESADGKTILYDNQIPSSPQSFPASSEHGGSLSKSSSSSPPPVSFHRTSEENAQVAIVIEETAPPVASYQQTFSQGVKLGDGYGEFNDEKSRCKKPNRKVVIAILAAVFILMCLAVISFLGYYVSEKDNEIKRLRNFIALLENPTSAPATINPTSPTFGIVVNNVSSSIPPNSSSIDFPSSAPQRIEATNTVNLEVTAVIEDVSVTSNDNEGSTPTTHAEASDGTATYSTQ